MAVENWSAEGGTNGTTLSGANTGGTSGLAFSGTDGGLSIGASTTLTFTTAEHSHGSVGVSVSKTSGSAGVYAQRTISGSPARHVSRVYVKFSAFPAGNTGVLRFLNTSNSAALSIFVDSTGKIVVQNAAGTAMFTATSSLSTGTWYRIECGVAPGTTSSTGAYDFAYYTGDSTTTIQTSSLTGQNLGTVAAIGNIRVGRFDTGSATGGYFWDNFGNESKGSGLIGPFGVTPPTAGGTGTDDTFTYDMRALSAASPAAGALTFAVTWNSGQVLTNSEPVDGYFVFTKSAAGTSQYKGTVSETGGTTADILIDIPQLFAGELVSYAPLMWNGSVWQ